MKLYISGPMTGYEDHNRPAFNEAEDLLVHAGFEVLNPSTVSLGEGATWQAYMREALRMMSIADGVCMLPRWQRSKGARVEYKTATGIGLPVHSLHEWLRLERKEEER